MVCIAFPVFECVSLCRQCKLLRALNGVPNGISVNCVCTPVVPLNIARHEGVGLSPFLVL